MPVKILHSGPISSFATPWLADLIQRYFVFEPFENSKHPPGTLFYVNCLNHTQEVSDQLTEQGYRVIIDNLWEINPGPAGHAHRICCDRWFWYNESLWYKHLNYDQYIPVRNYQYRALMPMNRRKPHRDELIKDIDLKNILWSYVATGQQLPKDQDMTHWQAQRYMNAEWYNTSYMSMVVESLVRPGSKYTPVFVTEKTVKPLAFWHPFAIYGNRGTLRTLRSWGFETFGNLWDESYDEIVDADARRNAVVNLINNMKVCPHSQETLRKLEHNHNLFFDTEKVETGIVKEIIEPLLEYAETNL